MKRLLLLGLTVVLMVSCDRHVQIKKDYWENGNLKSELRYEDGALNGRSIWYMVNGKPQIEVTYKNDTMNGLYLCVNGNSSNLGNFTGLCCEDDCEDCVKWGENDA